MLAGPLSDFFVEEASIRKQGSLPMITQASGDIKTRQDEAMVLTNPCFRTKSRAEFYPSLWAISTPTLLTSVLAMFPKWILRP